MLFSCFIWLFKDWNSGECLLITLNKKVILFSEANQVLFNCLHYGYLLPGWQCPASPAVNLSGWRYKPIVTLTAYPSKRQNAWSVTLNLSTCDAWAGDLEYWQPEVLTEFSIKQP